MNLHSLALLVPLLPVLAAALIGLVRPIGRRGGLAATISIGAATASLVCALILLLHTDQPFVWKVAWLPGGGRALAEIGLAFHGISAPMLVVVGTVALLVQIYSLGYLLGEAAGRARALLHLQSLFAVLDDGLRARAEPAAALHLLGAGRPLLLPADRLSGTKPAAGARRGEGVLDDQARRRGLPDRPAGRLDAVRASTSSRSGRCSSADRCSPTPGCCRRSCSAAWRASRRSSRCTSGCPTRWRARRRSPR